jgi:glutathione S-transferase
LIPAGTMPAIVDGDLVLADSEAIAEYLNETLAEPAMLPDDAVARARCRERSRFHDTRLEPEVRALFPHVGKATAAIDNAEPAPVRTFAPARIR